jgi:capsular polysaccharide transport system permease protein
MTQDEDESVTIVDPTPEIYTASVLEGRNLLAAGLAEEAVCKFRDALATTPRNAEINYHLGCALILAGHAAHARAPLRRAAKDHRHSVMAWHQLAAVEAQTGRPVRAAAALRRVVTLQPGWVSARLRYGQLLFHLAKMDLAMEQAVAILHLDPHVSEAHRLFGLALCRRRRFAEAATAFAAWVRSSPGEAKALFFLARARTLAGDQQAARSACLRAIALDPTFVRGHLLMARIALTNGNLWQGQTHLKTAIDLRPKSAILRARLAEVMLARSQYKAAIKMAKSAYACGGDCDRAILVIAKCHIGLGEIVKARSVLTRLERQRPNWAELGGLRAALSLHRSTSAPGPKRPVAPERTPSGTAMIAAPSEPAGPILPLPPRAPTVLPASVREEPDRKDRAPSNAIVAAGVPRKRDTFHPGLVDNLFIVQALILRHLRLKYKDNQFGIAMELVRPIVVVVAHYYLFWLLRRPMPGNVPIAVFVLGGFSVWFAFNSSEQGAIIGGKWPRGTTLLPGVTGMHTRLAKSVWSLLLNLTFCLVAFLPLNLYGAQLPLPNVPLTFLIFSLAGVMGFGFGLLIERMSQIWPVVKPLEKIVTWALFITSGMYFSISTMHPPILARAVWYNPILHLVEYERHAFDPGYPVAQVTLLYPATFAIGFLFIGLLAFKCLPVRD